MAALAGQKLTNIQTAVLNNHVRGKAFESSIQERPLLARLRSKQKPDFQIAFTSFTNTDTVTYGDTNRMKQAAYTWREYHAGIQLTVTELKQSGFIVDDDMAGIKAHAASDSDIHRLTDLLVDKMDDLTEGMLDSLNTQLFEDGTGSATDILGITGLITDNPSVGVIAGIDRALFPYWRNRARTAANGATAITSGVADGGLLLTEIQKEMRQLRRFGGRPSFACCGSDFLEAMEREIRANGNYSLTGFSKGQDISVGGIRWKDVDFMYDPTMDGTIGGVNRTKYAYLIDERNLKLRPLKGDDFKVHSPARPENQYVLNKGITWSGAITANSFNRHAVLQIL